MKKASKFELFLTLFTDSQSTFKFAIGVILGFGFSIAVILSTLGIMDGFERSLKSGLKKSTGDLTINSRLGFFELNQNMKKVILDHHIAKYSELIQTESFLIFNEESKGVLVKGIDDYYGEIVGLKLKLNHHEVAIGSEISKALNIKINDEIVLAFAKGNNEFKSLPGLNRYKVVQIIEHGIYQKDSRLVYLPISEVQKTLEVKDRINSVALNIDRDELTGKNEEEVFKNKIESLQEFLGNEFFLRPYWKDFSSLLEAVKVEKVMITLILQLVVVISIFNVLAFIMFINEKKSKELFLFKALGLSQKMLSKLWLKLVFSIWAMSCVVSIIFVMIFKMMLKYISFFNLPAEIYFMPRLELYLNYKDYAVVFFMALIWINVITFFLLRRIKNKNLLEGLRQEFA
jgi:ABC-type lipoprotein release transport system permease subunit